MLVFIIFGFLGNIEFTRSGGQVMFWVVGGGGILGIALGLVFAVITAFVMNIFPRLKCVIHPLAPVRAMFIMVIVWPLVALIGWPATGLGFILGPIIAFVVAILSIISNPHSELVPRSTMGRILGTSASPFVIVAVILIVIIPMFNRGFGSVHPAKMIVIAVDGVDGPVLRQYFNGNESSHYPNLKLMYDTGSYGEIGSNEPLNGARMWAEIMTSTDEERHGILDIHSVEEDLGAMTAWEIMAKRGNRIGLFQAAPVHPEFGEAAFDVPGPGTARVVEDPLALVLGEIRWSGRQEGHPSPLRLAWAGCMLARHGVRLDTIEELAKEILWESTSDPSDRLVYVRRKLLEFKVEADCALALLRSNSVDAAVIRFTSLEPIFAYYWRYVKPNEFNQPITELDTWELTGLSRAIPDAYSELDEFIGKLGTFSDYKTNLVVVSNHGTQSATERRRQTYTLSPSRLIRAMGYSDRVVGDWSDDGIIMRARSELDVGVLDEVSEILATAQWELDPSLPASGATARSLFITERQENWLEASIIENINLNKESVVTIGGYHGRFMSILVQGEQPSGKINGSGLFLATGRAYKSNMTARDPYTFDIAPTLLHAMGIEVSREMIGHTLEELYTSEWFSNHAVIYVDNYEEMPEIEEEEAVQVSIGMEESVVEIEPII